MQMSFLSSRKARRIQGTTGQYTSAQALGDVANNPDGHQVHHEQVLCPYSREGQQPPRLP